MKTSRRLPLLATVSCLVVACTDNSTTPTESPAARRVSGAGPYKHVFHGRGWRGPTGAYAPPGPMTDHGGAVMTAPKTYAIFWGTSLGTDPTFTADKMTGLATFFQGVGGSPYERILTEYSGSVWVNDTVLYTYLTLDSLSHYGFGGSFVDNRSAPSSDPSSSTVTAEVCSVLSINGVTPSQNGFYSVYATTPFDPISRICAWHSYGDCGNARIKIAFYFDLDNACSPNDASGLHSSGLAALANVSAHELSETITDPTLVTWYATDGSGEVGDKCAWTFSDPLVTLANGAQFKLQDEWSNKAYSGGFGYQNQIGEAGCLDGQVWPHVMVSITSGNSPSKVPTQQYCNWTASAIGGTPPYTLTWTVEGSNVTPLTATGPTLSAMEYTPGPFAVYATVTDAGGSTDNFLRDVRGSSGYWDISNCPQG